MKKTMKRRKGQREEEKRSRRDTERGKKKEPESAPWKNMHSPCQSRA